MISAHHQLARAVVDKAFEERITALVRATLESRDLARFPAAVADLHNDLDAARTIIDSNFSE